MPLLDHFHEPLASRRHWESFHAVWATSIMAKLNAVLPQRYFAEAQVQLGGQLEVDVGTFDEQPLTTPANGGTATLAAPAWAPPVTELAFPAVFPDEIEVRVYGGPTGAHLVAALELVSPANKDRPETRQAFTVKCASYLQAGVGLVVVDIVTERRGNLHDELMTLLGHAAPFPFPEATPLYATAYRPARRPAGDLVDLWRYPLSVGHDLPVVPLALRGYGCVPVDLERTYTEARQQSRL
jgi:hypothetical protein